MDLYYSDLQGTVWGPPINLGPIVNTEGNEIFPFVDINNRLYFSSNGHIGLGGLDQYYTTPGEGKTWNLPVNLGAPINSGNDDFGIIFGPTGEWGYFSSDRDHGVGGDDIYGFQKSASPVEVYVFDTQTNQPMSGAAVLNSLTGVNMMTGPDGKIAFDMRLTDCADFSVQKKGYENNMKNACATASTPGQMTRVEIALQKQANYMVQGIVFDMMNGMPADGAQVMITNDCGKPIPALVTTKGDGRFKFKLDKDCCYSIRATKDGYIADIQSDICTKGVAKNSTLKSTLSLQPYRDSEGFAIAPPGKTPTQGPTFNVNTGFYTNVDGSLATFELGEGLHVKDGILYDNGAISKPTQGDWERGSMGYLVNIYHDYDQSSLRDESVPDLEKLLKTLRDNPEIFIQISSHTDSRGTSEYNILLSQRRADAVVDWLSQKGISKDRLTGKGYGESKPVNACNDDANCPES
jgi:outer membrane protein OmpA-like peptidoglycan-associated protein